MLSGNNKHMFFFSDSSCSHGPMCVSCALRSSQLISLVFTNVKSYWWMPAYTIYNLLLIVMFMESVKRCPLSSSAPQVYSPESFVATLFTTKWVCVRWALTVDEIFTLLSAACDSCSPSLRQVILEPFQNISHLSVIVLPSSCSASLSIIFSGLS